MFGTFPLPSPFIFHWGELAFGLLSESSRPLLSFSLSVRLGWFRSVAHLDAGVLLEVSCFHVLLALSEGVREKGKSQNCAVERLTGPRWAQTRAVLRSEFARSSPFTGKQEALRALLRESLGFPKLGWRRAASTRFFSWSRHGLHVCCLLLHALPGLVRCFDLLRHLACE